MSFGIPVRNGLSISLLSTTALSTGRGLVPALGLNFLSGALDPRITFSRGSNATLTDSTGRITYAPTNLLTNSESFDNSSSWIKSAIGVGTAPAVTANAGVAPDGTTTADLVTLVNTGTTLSDWSWIYQNTTPAANTTYIFSVWLKAATPSDVGKVVIITGIPTDSVTLTANWQRVFWRGTTTSTSTISSGIRLRGVETATTSASFLMWGAQLSPVTYQTTPGTYNSTTPKNLLGFTQEFDNAAWTKSNATVTANATTAPDGTLSADKLVETTAASSHYALQAATVAAAPYTFSTYAKAGERSFVSLAFDGLNAWFNLSTGAVGTVEAGLTASITAVGNGWYRCAIFRTVSVAGSKSSAIYPTNANNVVSYTGDGTSGIFIWGAQLSDSASLDPYVYNPVAAPTAAAYYGPRFDYDPVTLAAKGLLIEEARTNLLTYSAQFDDAAWTKLNATVTANATTSPDGNTNADKLVEDATNATHVVYQGPVFAGSTTYTVSVFAKAAERSKLNVFCNGISSTAGNLFDVTFDLSNGTLSATHGTGTITPVGNGWYRCTVTNTYAATGASANIQLRLNNGSTTSYAGTAGNGLFIYGAQLEAGSFATSYIPTVASQVTRSADVALMQGANFSNWYNQNEGTFIGEVSFFGLNKTASDGFLDASNGSANETIAIYRTGAPSNIQAAMRDNGADQAVYNIPLGSQPVKVAFAYATNNTNFAQNGAAQTTDTVCTIPTPDRLLIGSVYSAGNLPTNGHIRSIGYYNTRQPNATLQTLTNPSTTPSLALNFISDTYTVGA